MLSFDEALARVLAAAPVLGSEIVPLELAGGRVLAEEIRARSDLPPFAASAMDGYAVATSSFIGDPPWDLDVSGESRTGRAAPPFAVGTACRIFTGAEVPSGADAVVMQEDVERLGNVARFSILPKAGQHIRPAGEDLRRDTVALGAGTRLGAYQLGLAAASDVAHVRVARRPTVAILSTGDELRAPGSPSRPASIPESNGLVIAALATAAGADVRATDVMGDDLDLTRDRVRTLLDSSDLLVTIGGVSVGDHDVVRPALEAAGAKLEFHKVAIKPGKPLTLGRYHDVVVLGLPGNPVSAQVTFALFGLPLLRKMQGDTRHAPAPRRARLAASLKQRPGRKGYYAATLDGDSVMPLSGQSSGSTVSLARANALAILPADSSGLGAGDILDVLLLSEL
jgi:molybdopterin molybdotransferase